MPNSLTPAMDKTKKKLNCDVQQKIVELHKMGSGNKK